MTHPMRDDDRMLDLPGAEFGSGVIGICDICGVRQAVVVLTKERFKLCVLDFLNKTWIKTDRKPGVPAPLYRSERVWFDSESVPSGRAQGVVLSPTKVVKHPAVLVTPDVFGLTTTLLDGAIRLARDGFEVLLPDIGKTGGVGPGLLALRSGVRLRGGVSVRSKKAVNLLHLYTDALEFLRAREMVDPGKSAVFGVSYGASLALALAAQDTRLGALVLAYPMPVDPADLGRLVTAPVLLVAGSKDPAAARARRQWEAVRGDLKVPLEVVEIAGARHHFLARDLSTYNLAQAEEAWNRIVGFLRTRLIPPPPRPSPPPVVKASAVLPPSPPSSAVPATPGSRPSSPVPGPASRPAG